MSDSLRTEDLLTIQMCERAGGVPIDEAAIRERVLAAPLSRKQKTAAMAAADLIERARNGILYVVDSDVVYRAIQSADAPPRDLPPLPFGQILLENSGPHAFGVALYPGELPLAEREPDRALAEVFVDVVWIEEQAQGEQWLVHLYAREGIADGADVPWGVVPLLVRADELGRIHSGREEVFAWDHPHVAFYWRFVVELVHFITARGVTTTAVSQSRQVRRAQDRRGVVMPACLYWVTVEDEHHLATGGTGDRIYHCRWLVRGHWRHLDGKRKSWIRPYIKGPAGAPWRGRPVYRVEAAA